MSFVSKLKTLIEEAEIGDLELLYEVISRMSESKWEESTLLLNVIKREEAVSDSLKLTDLNIKSTLNNLGVFDYISYLDFVQSFALNTNAGNTELISFETSFDAETEKMKVSDLNTLVGYDLSKQADAFMTSSTSPTSYLPEKGTLLCQDNFKVLSNVVSQVDASTFNAEVVGAAISQTKENSASGSVGSDGGLSGVAIAFIVIGVIVAVALIAFAVYYFYNRKNEQETPN